METPHTPERPQSSAGPGAVSSSPGSAGGWVPPGCAPERSPALAAALSALEDGLRAVAELSLTGLGEAEVAELLEATTRAVARSTAATARVAAEADRRQLGEAVGARHTALWWANQTRLTRGEAGRLLALGRALDQQALAPVGSALAAGRILADQAGVIVHALAALPTDLPDPTLRAQARDHLLAAAADHDARALRILGKRILDILAPQIGEAHEQRLLEREEQAAAAAARFTMVDDGHGQSHGRFTLPTLHAEMLRAHLHALANPRRHHSPDQRDEHASTGHQGRVSGPVITPERLGQALMEYIERYPADGLPAAWGIPATVTVTMTLDTLLTGLGTATLDTGARISASQARRLACHAGLVPAVLGTDSEVLDLGQLSRFFNTPQRRAMILRDGGCTTLGCGLPPSVCHAHHDQPWSQGGPTDLAHGRLLCPRHHRLAHDSRYTTTHHPHHKVSFTRRT